MTTHATVGPRTASPGPVRTAHAPNSPTAIDLGRRLGRVAARYGRVAMIAAAVLVGLQVAAVVLRAPIDADSKAGGITFATLLTAVVLVAGQSRRHAWRGGAQVMAAVAGIAVSAASLFRTAIEGPGVDTILGAAATIASVGLLVVGSVNLLRTLPGWWRMAAIPVGFCLVQFVVIPVAAGTAMSQQPREPLTMTAPFGAAEVSFRTRDGVRLTGWYTASKSGAAVVLLPGSGGNRSSTVEHGAALIRHGYGVLAVDGRGTGTSEGTAMAWGWYGNLDIAGAVDFLIAQPDVDPARIAVVGLSMGGEQAITAAAAEARIRAVVAEGASARMADDMGYLPDTVTGLIQHLNAVVMFGVADLLTPGLPPMPLRDAVRDMNPRPLLIIAGADPDEAAANRVFHDIAPDRVELWLLPDTPHIQGLWRHPQEYEQRVASFLAASL